MNTATAFLLPTCVLCKVGAGARCPSGHCFSAFGAIGPLWRVAVPCGCWELASPRVGLARLHTSACPPGRAHSRAGSLPAPVGGAAASHTGLTWLLPAATWALWGCPSSSPQRPGGSATASVDGLCSPWASLGCPGRCLGFSGCIFPQQQKEASPRLGSWCSVEGPGLGHPPLRANQQAQHP